MGHGLRHAHATHALEKEAGLSAIQKTLGHQNIKTTGRYLATSVEDYSSLLINEIPQEHWTLLMRII